MQPSQNDKFADAQREILARISNCELALADLYESIAGRLTSMEGFWRGLAREELGHAAMINSLEKFLDRGFLFDNLGRFDVAKYAAFVDRIRAEVDALATGELTVERALMIAMACESAPLESGFYKTVESDAPEFKMIAGHLERCTREHFKLVESCLARVRSARGDAQSSVSQAGTQTDSGETPPEPFGWLG